MEILLFFPVLAIIGLIAYFAIQSEKKRRAAFAAFAAARNLHYSHVRDAALAKRYGLINRIRRGSNRYAHNVISGTYKGVPICIFDFHYETSSSNANGGSSTQHHHHAFYTVLFNQKFPEVLVTHEGIFSKLIQAIGFDDIDFESHEFSSHFNVKSRDKRFAYDVCNARMIDYLLDHKDLEFEIAYDHRLDLSRIERELAPLLEIRARLPEYLVGEISRKETAT